jgi:hypothetical protein
MFAVALPVTTTLKQQQLSYDFVRKPIPLKLLNHLNLPEILPVCI